MMRSGRGARATNGYPLVFHHRHTETDFLSTVARFFANALDQTQSVGIWDRGDSTDETKGTNHKGNWHRHLSAKPRARQRSGLCRARMGQALWRVQSKAPSLRLQGRSGCQRRFYRPRLNEVTHGTTRLRRPLTASWSGGSGVIVGRALSLTLDPD